MPPLHPPPPPPPHHHPSHTQDKRRLTQEQYEKEFQEVSRVIEYKLILAALIDSEQMLSIEALSAVLQCSTTFVLNELSRVLILECIHLVHESNLCI